MAQEFFVKALTNGNWEAFESFKDKALEEEAKHRASIKKLIREFCNNANSTFNFKDLFSIYDGKLETSEIKKEIETYDDCRTVVNDVRHAKENYRKAFITGEKSIRNYRGYYAVILTLIVLLNISSSDKIISINKLYMNLFDQWNIPVGYRNDIRVTANDIDNGAEDSRLDNKILFLIISIYMSILFDGRRRDIAYKEKCKDNLKAIVAKAFTSQDHARTIDETRNVFEKVKSTLSGRIVPRNEIEDLLGPVRNLFICEGERIVYDAAFAMYTGDSFLNVVDADHGIADDRLVTTEPQILKYLEDGGNLNIILTDPFSASADEAVFSDRLGNRKINGTDTSFSRSYNVIKNLKRKNAHYRNFEIKYTNMSLPYSIMRIEFMTPYSEYNYVKIDLYSFGMRKSADRLSIIVFQDTDKLIYNTLSDQIEYITKKSYNLDTDYAPEIKVFSKDEYEAAEYKRVYFTGQKIFDENHGIKNTYSDVEWGVTLYPNECVDKPHYHRTTNEHYMVVKGFQKILEISTMREFTVNEGDVVFIPKLTPYVTKEAANTKVVFAKSPLGMDKESVEINCDIQKWMKAPMDRDKDLEK